MVDAEDVLGGVEGEDVSARLISAPILAPSRKNEVAQAGADTKQISDGEPSSRFKHTR